MVAFFLAFSFGKLSSVLSMMANEIPEMLTSGVILSFVASVLLYIKGAFIEGWKLNPNGNTSWSTTSVTFEPSREKTNNVVFEQVRDKPACAAREDS